MINQRLEEIADEMLLAKDIDVAGLAPYERKRLLHTNRDLLPREYTELSEIARTLQNLDVPIERLVRDKSYTTRVKLSASVTKKEDDIVDHLLAEIDPTDVARVYRTNRKKFVTEFPKTPLNRQRYAILRILNNEKGGKA
mgnify:CR=1 FL=1